MSHITYAPAGVMPAGRLLRAYAIECKYELLRLMRVPAFVAPTVVLPLLMFILFGLVLPFAKDEAGRRTVLISFCIFGAISPGLFAFGIGVAAERSQGLLTLKRAQPAPRGAYLLGKIVMSVLSAALVCTVLTCFVLVTGTVPLSLAEAATLIGLGALCVIPFCALGLFIGSATSAQIAPMLTNLLYLMMSALSGLWVPLGIMPKVMQQAAWVWPSYHVVRIVNSVFGLGASKGFPLASLLLLVAATAVFSALAAWRLARVEE